MERRRAAGLAVTLLLAAAGAEAQAPSASPSPPVRLPRAQDEVALQARSNVVEGSGARALGMGGAFLARADDATAASWNPAGLSYLRQAEVSAVWTHTKFNTAQRVPEGPVTKTDIASGSTPDFFAATYPVGLGGMAGSAQLSFQRVISYRYDRTIDEDQPLTATSGKGFDVIAFGGGLQVARWLRLGATVNRWFHGYTQHSVRTISNSREVGTRTLDNDFHLSAWNANVGAIWSPTERLNLGAVYKTAFAGDVKLSRLREDVIFTATEDRVITNAHARDDLVVHFPGALGVGTSFRPWSTMTVSVDYTRSFWSNGRIENFFTLPRTGTPESTEPPLGPDYFPDLPYPTLVDTEQKDTEQLRAGLEYVVIGGRLKVPLRIGYFNDRQYFRANQIVVAGMVIKTGAPRFDAVTAGAGLIVGNVLLDAAYVYEHGSYADLDANLVRVRDHRFFVSLIYRHARH